MVTLRDYTAADTDRLVELANDKNVSRYLVDTFPYPYTRQDAVWWIETGCLAHNSITKVIAYQGDFVGTIGITPQTGWQTHTAEIGYWVAKSYWGRGIASQALRIMTEFVFSELHYQKLFAPVLSPNKASMRVLEKCGYVLEGVFKHDVIKDGQCFDRYYYAKYHPSASS